MTRSRTQISAVGRLQEKVDRERKMESDLRGESIPNVRVRGQGTGVNHQMWAKKQLWGPNQTSGGKGKKKMWPNDRYCPQEKNERKDSGHMDKKASRVHRRTSFCLKGRQEGSPLVSGVLIERRGCHLYEPSTQPPFLSPPPLCKVTVPPRSLDFCPMSWLQALPL